jgi:hypothetical protein
MLGCNVWSPAVAEQNTDAFHPAHSADISLQPPAAQALLSVAIDLGNNLSVAAEKLGNLIMAKEALIGTRFIMFWSTTLIDCVVLCYRVKVLTPNCCGCMTGVLTRDSGNIKALLAAVNAQSIQCCSHVWVMLLTCRVWLQVRLGVASHDIVEADAALQRLLEVLGAESADFKKAQRLLVAGMLTLAVLAHFGRPLW